MGGNDQDFGRDRICYINFAAHLQHFAKTEAPTDRMGHPAASSELCFEESARPRLGEKCSLDRYRAQDDGILSAATRAAAKNRRGRWQPLSRRSRRSDEHSRWSSSRSPGR